MNTYLDGFEGVLILHVLHGICSRLMALMSVAPAPHTKSSFPLQGRIAPTSVPLTPHSHLEVLGHSLLSATDLKQLTVQLNAPLMGQALRDEGPCDGEY